MQQGYARNEPSDAWVALRRAVAEEFIEKLPTSLSLDEVAALTGKPDEVVLNWAAHGIIAVRGDGEGARMWPADNMRFLMNEMVLLLPLPAASASGGRRRRRVAVARAPRAGVASTMAKPRIAGC